jgi:thiol-disulfide isomerase/thioredoxin
MHPRRAVHTRISAALAVIAAVAAIAWTLLFPSKVAISGAQATTMQSATSTRLPSEGKMPSLDGAITWINSPTLKTADLHGKVVLVEFWTYTCINWRRQFPYVRAWADKYRDKGLVVIGVHTPEFAFEKDLDNVRLQTKQIPVQFPIAVDSDYTIWRAFDNHYWPALYFVDAQGRIRHHQFGEGDYERSETVIKQLLTEAGATAIDTSLVPDTGRGPEAAASWEDLKSPETYVGYEQTQNFASPGGPLHDKPHSYSNPAGLPLNHWSLTGNWTITRDRSHSNDSNGQLTFRFHARDLHLVMGPSVSGKPVRFRLLIDGQPPGAAHGVDVDEQGYGTMSEQRMYQLVRQQKPIADRTFTINFLDPGAEVFCFTFG